MDILKHTPEGEEKRALKDPVGGEESPRSTPIPARRGRRTEIPLALAAAQPTRSLHCEWIEPLQDTVLLNFKILADGLLALQSERDREIIKLRYGIEHPESMSLNDIGEQYGLTRERVRQIIYKYISTLGNTIYAEIRSVAIEEEPRQSLVEFLAHLAGRKFVHFDAMANALCLPFKDFASREGLCPYIVLAVDLLPHANITLDDRNFVLFANMTQGAFLDYWKHLRKYAKSIVLPTSIEDVIAGIIDETPVPQAIGPDTIRAILTTLMLQEMYLEGQQDSKIQTQFVELPTIGQQAERILFEAGKPLHYDEIRQEVIARQERAGDTNVPQPDFNTGLFGLNPNVESKEKSGYWRLTYWKND